MPSSPRHCATTTMLMMTDALSMTAVTRINLKSKTTMTATAMTGQSAPHAIKYKVNILPMEPYIQNLTVEATGKFFTDPGHSQQASLAR